MKFKDNIPRPLDLRAGWMYFNQLSSQEIIAITRYKSDDTNLIVFLDENGNNSKMRNTLSLDYSPKFTRVLSNNQFFIL